jgi:hypothetical protein
MHLFRIRRESVPPYLHQEYKEFFQGFKNYSASVDSVIGRDIEGKEALQRKGVIFLQQLALDRQYTQKSQDDYAALTGSGATNLGCRIQFVTHITLSNVTWKVRLVI